MAGVEVCREAAIPCDVEKAPTFNAA